MKVDAYRSGSHPSYGLVVPARAALSDFTGEVAVAISKLQPLTKSKTGDLDTMFNGDLVTFLESQLKEKGAGLAKVAVSFTELAGG